VPTEGVMPNECSTEYSIIGRSNVTVTTGGLVGTPVAPADGAVLTTAGDPLVQPPMTAAIASSESAIVATAWDLNRLCSIGQLSFDPQEYSSAAFAAGAKANYPAWKDA